MEGAKVGDGWVPSSQARTHTRRNTHGTHPSSYEHETHTYKHCHVNVVHMPHTPTVYVQKKEINIVQKIQINT